MQSTHHVDSSKLLQEPDGTLTPLFQATYRTGHIIGYFSDGYCRFLDKPSGWREPHCRWWWGNWQKVCVGALEMHTGRWEFDEAATVAYVSYLNQEIAVAE